MNQKFTMKVTAATVNNPAVYCRATAVEDVFSKDNPNYSPIPIVEASIRWLSKELSDMIRHSKEWDYDGEDLTKNVRFKWLKDELTFERAMLEEAKKEWVVGAQGFTAQDLAAKFNQK
jgi:hypothetical protein